MKVWVLKRTTGVWVDEYRGMVVVAESEIRARALAVAQPRYAEGTGALDFADPTKSTCEEVSVDTEGVVLEDFWEA